MRRQQRQLRSRRNERGNAVVEFALAFALLVPLFLSAYQFGYAFYVYNGIQTAVRSGARYASMATYNSPTETPSGDFTAAVRNMVVYGSPDAGTLPVVPGLTPEDVSVSMQFVNGAPARVTIAVTTYRADASVALVEVRQKPNLTVPYTGRWDPS